MATVTGIKAGRAFVELFADDSPLTQNLKQAETKVQAFGTVGGSAMAYSLGGGFKTAGNAAKLFGDELAGVAGNIKSISLASNVVGSLLSGPMGWIGLAATGAVALIANLQKVREVIDYTGQSVKKLAEEMQNARWPEEFGRTADIDSAGKLTFEKSAAAAVAQHAEASRATADAQRDLGVATDVAAAKQKELNSLLEIQQRYLRAMATYRDAESYLRQVGTRQAGERRDRAREELKAAQAAIGGDKDTMKEDIAARVKQAANDAAVAATALMDAQRKMNDSIGRQRRAGDEANRLTILELGANAAAAAVQELTDKVQQLDARESVELLADLSAAATAGAVQAAAMQPRLAGQPYVQDIFTPDGEASWRLFKEREDREREHRRRINAATQRDDREAARLEIELSGKTQKEKARDLMKLRHEQEIEDLWGTGLGDTAAEKTLLDRQALEARALAQAQAQAQAGQHTLRQSVSGTFNATMVGRMGGGNYAERTARATEKTAKNTEELLKKPAAALAFG